MERRRPCSVCGVTRFVVDCDTLLRIAAGEIEVAAEHQLVAPTLVRSQALAALYQAARAQDPSVRVGMTGREAALVCAGSLALLPVLYVFLHIRG